MGPILVASRQFPNHALLRTIVLFLGLQPFIQTVNGYFLDDSCSAKQKEFLDIAFGNAFSLIYLAESAVGPVANNDQQQLVGWLFGPQDDYTRQSVTATVTGLATMAGIGKKNTKEELSRGDFRVYCDDKRLKFKALPKPKWYDPDIEENLSISTKFDCGRAFAYTWIPTNPLLPTQIQLCPWFLDYAMTKDPAFQNDVDPGIIPRLAAKLDNWVTNQKYTPIDLFSLFDKVLVHEMTHTRNGGQTTDVGGFDGYGWKNCRALSTVRTNVANQVYGPEKNADSIALLASANALLIRGVAVHENGHFTDVQVATKNKAKRFLVRDPVALRARSLYT